MLEPFKVTVLFLADSEQGFELIYPAQNTWKSRPWSNFYAILLSHEYLNRLCRISWLWQKRLRQRTSTKIFKNALCAVNGQIPASRRSWPVHFITLYESSEPWAIRQKWKMRLHFSYLKCCFFCLVIQICQNKIFCFRLNKIFCMNPKWLVFHFRKKERELYKPEWKKITQNEIFIFQSSFQIKAHISWMALIYRSVLKSCWISPL